MNYLEQPLTFITQATGTYGIAYLMCNEIYEAIEFGNLVTTGTISSNYIVLGSSPAGEFDINSYGPITITFNPSSLNFPKKINRIEYYINDDLQTVHSFYYSETSIDTRSYPYPNEPGDPRNYPFTKTFKSENYSTDTTIFAALVYQLGIVDPIFLFYNVNIIPPNVDDYETNSNSDVLNVNPYFKEMHLISTRMFGPNNDILYTFETKNPNYIAPVIINWQKDPVTIPTKTSKTSKVFDKKYRILEPYEISDLSNKDIKIITQVGKFKALNF
jgi:hypothetical protein